MPRLSCGVSNCSHNESSLCNLNSINVSGGASKQNTCCSSFTDVQSASNCCGSASPETKIACHAKDCSHNEGCTCHADSVKVASVGSACNCHDTQCNSFCKG